MQLAMAIVPVVLAITLHEAAHGYAALALGDDTARRAGRLSLNPLRHVDRVGTLLLPGFLILTQLATIGRVAFMFGWAKPVPVAAWKFRDPRRAMMLVAAAGPAMNFSLAILAGMLLPHMPAADAFDYFDRLVTSQPVWGVFAFYFILTNLVLGLFNLIPIPPLDGGRIAVGLLPPGAAKAWARMERAGIFVVLAVVFLLPRLLAEFGVRFDPFGEALTRVLPWALRLVLSASGHHVGVPDGHVI
ncbi:MAG: site-2 protease family protein [Acetobacteraceae bacterium]|nr:site-2 protease family protein [Acetobacteraceae bacterium]